MGPVELALVNRFLLACWRTSLVALLALFFADTAPAADDAWKRHSDAAFSRAVSLTLGATDIVQDGDGFLWVATQSGLQRWDGHQLRTYRADIAAPGALPDSFLLDLFVDSRRQLWLGTNSAGLVRYDPLSDTFASPLAAGESLSRASVYAFAEDGAGGLWIGTGGGLDRLDVATGKVLKSAQSPLASSLPKGGVRALLRCPDGTLWVGAEKGLFRLVPGGDHFETVALRTGEGEVPIVSKLMLDDQGRVWIGTRVHGAFVAAPGEGAAKPLRELATGDVGTGTETVTALAQAREGEVWVGLSGEGILRVDSMRWASKRERHQDHAGGSLADNDVFALYRDDRGLVWVATDTALSFATQQQDFATLFGGGANSLVSHPNVPFVLPRPDGRIWVSVGDGGIDIVEATQGRLGQLRPDPSRPATALPKGRVLSMVPAADGGVYLGTQRGLYWADARARSVRRIIIEGRPATASVWAMAWQGNKLWIGRLDGLWCVEPAVDGSMKVMAREEGPRLGDQRLTALLPAPDGTLWIGTSSGLVKLDPVTMAVSRLPEERAGRTGLPAAYVSSLLYDEQGTLWVGVFGAGIRAVDWPVNGAEPRIRRITISEGLPHNGVNALVLDWRGDLWASTDDGIARIAADTGAVEAFGAAHGIGIQAYWTNSGALTGDGHILFGGSGGLTVVDPSSVTSSSRDHIPLAVTEIRLGDASRLSTYRGGVSGAPLVVEQGGRRSVLVEFAALDFVAPQSRRYEHRMTGVDSGWIATDASHRIAAYTNLPPGDHTLELRSASGNGPWSEAVRLNIRVEPRWYETWWTRAIAVLVMAAILAGVVRARTAWLRLRQRALERLVAERTAQLQESQRQLEQIAYFDGLTGLANRRMFNDELRRMLAACHRGGTMALLLIDLDRFKLVNDTMGHDAGDAVLVAVASRLTSAVRETDRVVRLGGDEFAVLMPDVTNPADLDVICSRICQSVSVPIAHGLGSLQVGASIGAACAPLHAGAPDGLYKMADVALYDAKASGRNCWRAAEAALLKEAAARSDALSCSEGLVN